MSDNERINLRNVRIQGFADGFLCGVGVFMILLLIVVKVTR